MNVYITVMNVSHVVVSSLLFLSRIFLPLLYAPVQVRSCDEIMALQCEINPVFAKYALQVGLSSLLGCLFLVITPLEENLVPNLAQWTVITSCISLDATFGGSIKNATQNIVGTIFGSCIGLGLSFVVVDWSPIGARPYVMAAVVMLCTIIAGYLRCTQFGREYGSFATVGESSLCFDFCLFFSSCAFMSVLCHCLRSLSSVLCYCVYCFAHASPSV